MPAVLDALLAHRLPRAALHRRALRRLRSHLRWSMANVPYYKKAYGDAGVRPGKIDGIDALTSVPTIDKAVIQANFDALFSRNAPPRSELAMRSSSGSTGQPSVTYFDPVRECARRVQELRMLSTLGARPTDRQMVFDDVRNAPSSKHFVQKLGIWDRVYFPFERDPSEGLAEIEELQPEIINGVLTPLRMFAYHVRAEQDVLSYRPKMVLSKGELLDKSSRRLIESVFGAPLYDYYATEEVGIVAWQEPGQEFYNVDEDFVFVECIRPDGTPTEDGEPGELVLTNLYQRAMPIIRFRTGDFGVLHRSPEGSRCGLPRLSRLRGRQIDFIVTPDGQIIAPFVLMVILEETRKVLSFHIAQTAVDKVVVRFRLDPALSEEEASATLADVRTKMQEVLGDQVTVDLKIDVDLGVLKPGKSAIVEGLPGLVDQKLEEGYRLVF